MTSDSIRIKLLLFAQFREELGERTRELEVPATSTPRDVFRTLAQGHERLAALAPVCRFIVNGAFVEGDRTLHSGDEVAFIPPVAGGSCG